MGIEYLVIYQKRRSHENYLETAIKIATNTYVAGKPLGNGILSSKLLKRKKLGY